ncbi:MAG TPA: carbohydrate ABC transporter permease [Thermomicrobiales bacterium]|nr:carbohydrate ABC transporter permease [Thermomicrobiales bacterium]
MDFKQAERVSGAGTVAAPRRRSRVRGRFTPGRVAFTGVSQVFLIVWTVLVLFPLLWMVMTAFKTDKEILFSPWKFPAALQWENFSRAWTQASIGRYFINSIIVVAGSLLLTLLLSSMAAYVLARYDFPGNRAIYYLFMIGLMFPIFLALVPLFFVVQSLHMVSTYQGLILVYTAYSLPFSIFFLTSFFRTLPAEVAEAATVDGASPYAIFFRVMLPMAQPGIISIGIFNFLGQWNQFILPLVLSPDPNHYVLSQGLAFLAIQQGYQNDWSALFAGLTITMLPVLAVYIAFQHRLEAGLTAGALKG